MAKATKKTPEEASGLFHNIMAASVRDNPKPTEKESMNFKIGDIVIYNSSKLRFKIVATKEDQGNYLLPEGFDYLLLQTDKTRHKPAFKEDVTLASDQTLT